MNLQSDFEGVNSTVDAEQDDISMKTKMVVTPGIIAIKFGEKSFISTILGFNTHGDYEYYNEINSQNISNLSTIDKTHLKCDIFHGSVLNG